MIREMKKKVKARWTAREVVNMQGADGVEVDIYVTIHNLAELGFKHIFTSGKYDSIIQIPIERYRAMSPEEKRRECEKEVQWMLTELTRVKNRQRKAEEIGKIISQEVLTGETPFPQVQERKPLEIVDEELVKKTVEEAKKLVYDSPQWKKMLPIRELLTVAENYDLDEKWLSTAGYLLIEEIALKQWLIQHDHSKKDFEKKLYHQLLEMLEKDFEKMDKPISPKALSKFVGDRWFRNKVIHEGHPPSPKELNDTKKDAIGLLGFLNQN